MTAMSVQTKGLNYNSEFIESIQVRNLLVCLKMMAMSALARKESRGNHYRTDFPAMDNDHWIRNVVVENAGGEVQVRTEPVNAKFIAPPSGVYKFGHFITQIDAYR